MQTFDDFKKACLGKKYKKTIQVPYSDEEFLIDMRILSSHEAMEAEVAALNYISTKKVEKDSDTFFIETHCQVLNRCCFESGSDNRFFKTIEDTRSLPTEMIIYLWEQYTILSQEVSVVTEDITEELLEDVKKKLLNGEIPLGLSYSQLLQVLMVLGEFTPNQELEQNLPLDVDSETSQSNKQKSIVSSNNQSPMKSEKNSIDSVKKKKPVVEVGM